MSDWLLSRDTKASLTSNYQRFTRIGGLIFFSIFATITSDAAEPKCPPGEVPQTILGVPSGGCMKGGYGVADPSVIGTGPVRKPEKPGKIILDMGDTQIEGAGKTERLFYKVSVPQGRRLVVFAKPDGSSQKLFRLKNGASGVRVKRFANVGGRRWAETCKSGNCGWAVAKFLQPKERKSGKRLARAVPFSDGVQVWKQPTPNAATWIRTLNESDTVYIHDSTTNNSRYWYYVCGRKRTWCGWVEQDQVVRIGG